MTDSIESEFHFEPDTQLPLSVTCAPAAQDPLGIPQFCIVLPNFIDFGLSDDLDLLKGIGNLSRNGGSCVSTCGDVDATVAPSDAIGARSYDDADASPVDTYDIPDDITAAFSDGGYAPPAYMAGGPAVTSPVPSAFGVIGPDPRNLIVIYIPDPVKDADLHALFARFGELEAAYVVTDKQKSKGYGFVKFHDLTAADTAREAMNGAPLLHKRLRVARATGPESYQLVSPSSELDRSAKATALAIAAARNRDAQAQTLGSFHAPPPQFAPLPAPHYQIPFSAMPQVWPMQLHEQLRQQLSSPVRPSFSSMPPQAPVSTSGMHCYCISNSFALTQEFQCGAPPETGSCTGSSDGMSSASSSSTSNASNEVSALPSSRGSSVPTAGETNNNNSNSVNKTSNGLTISSKMNPDTPPFSAPPFYNNCSGSAPSSGFFCNTPPGTGSWTGSPSPNGMSSAGSSASNDSGNVSALSWSRGNSVPVAGETNNVNTGGGLSSKMNPGAPPFNARGNKDNNTAVNSAGIPSSGGQSAPQSHRSASSSVDCQFPPAETQLTTAPPANAVAAVE